MTFREKLNKYYYTYYLPKHRHSGTKFLHLAGCIFTILWTLHAVATMSIFRLLLAPLVVYPFAFAGHWIFEKNRPAAISGDYNFIFAKISDFRMCYEWLTRQIK